LVDADRAYKTVGQKQKETNKKAVERKPSLPTGKSGNAERVQWTQKQTRTIHFGTSLKKV